MSSLPARPAPSPRPPNEPRLSKEVRRTGVLAENVRKEIARATERTARNKGMVLTVALNLLLWSCSG